MMTRGHKLPIKNQTELLRISRGTAYYRPKPPPPSDLDMMRRMDELHLEYPWMGSRKFCAILNREGFKVGRRHVRKLMIKANIHAVYRKRNTSKPHPRNPVFPYLLRYMEITQSRQVYAMDITYIPMEKGFVYLCAVIDWASRMVLSYRLSNSMDTSFCIEAVEEAIEQFGCPQYFNTDQGSQFTSYAFTELLKKENIRISMDGKGSWRDNVFVERLWRSIKYEEVYLRSYSTVSSARVSIGKYIQFYNTFRPHDSLDNLTPLEYFNSHLPHIPAVA